jgi:cytochrome P450
LVNLERLSMDDSSTPDATDIRLDARDSAFREDPHPILDDLRARCPVHQDSVLDRVVLTRADDVAAVLADRTLSSDPFKGRPTTYGRAGLTDADRPDLPLPFLDDPDHARLRRLVVQAFSVRAVEALRPRIEAIAATLLDRIDSTCPFDLIADYAVPLPTLVIAIMLGIDDAEVEQFKAWSDAVLIGYAPGRTEAEVRDRNAANDGLNDCIRRAIVERRREPRDDLIGALTKAEAQGERLSDVEILNTCRTLLVAGNVTTTDLIGNGSVALLRHPEQAARLRADPGLWPAAVEEMLRYDPPVVSWNRQCIDDRLIDNCPVEAGQTVTAMLLAANHDPALHAAPHDFDIGRDRQKHHSFGGGAHFCLGASLARLEAQVALSALFDRFTQLQLAPRRDLQRKAIPRFGGYDAVWLTAV